MDYSLFEYGILRNMTRASVGAVRSLSPRGKVTCFSAHSRLRLRKWLLFKYVPDARMWGVTLTIPAQEDIDLAVRRFGVAVHRLRVYFVRRFPSCGFVWRVELQRSRMPHLHLVAYMNIDDVQSAFIGLWSDIVLPLFEVGSLSAFLRHGVVCKPLDGSIRAFRYLCDHGSKRKQAQLGWQGRQWGVVGRDFFVDRSSLRVSVGDSLNVRFERFLRRLVAFHVPKEGVPFGSRLVRRRGLNSVVYVNADTVARWLEYNDLPF